MSQANGQFYAILHPLVDTSYLATTKAEDVIGDYLKQSKAVGLFDLTKLRRLHIQTDEVPTETRFKDICTYKREKIAGGQSEVRLLREHRGRLLVVDGESIKFYKGTSPKFGYVFATNTGYQEYIVYSDRTRKILTRQLADVMESTDCSADPALQKCYAVHFSIDNNTVVITNLEEVSYEDCQKNNLNNTPSGSQHKEIHSKDNSDGSSIVFAFAEHAHDSLTIDTTMDKIWDMLKNSSIYKDANISRIFWGGEEIPSLSDFEETIDCSQEMTLSDLQCSLKIRIDKYGVLHCKKEGGDWKAMTIAQSQPKCSIVVTIKDKTTNTFIDQIWNFDDDKIYEWKGEECVEFHGVSNYTYHIPPATKVENISHMMPMMNVRSPLNTETPQSIHQVIDQIEPRLDEEIEPRLAEEPQAAQSLEFATRPSESTTMSDVTDYISVCPTDDSPAVLEPTPMEQVQLSEQDHIEPENMEKSRESDKSGSDSDDSLEESDDSHVVQAKKKMNEKKKTPRKRATSSKDSKDSSSKKKVKFSFPQPQYKQFLLKNITEMEVKGRILRPLYKEKVEDLKKSTLAKMYDEQNGSRTVMLISEDDDQSTPKKAIIIEGSHRTCFVLSFVKEVEESFEIPIKLFVVSNEDFIKAWEISQSLAFADAFPDKAIKVSEKAQFSRLPKSIVQISMSVHACEVSKHLGKFSQADDAHIAMECLQNHLTPENIALMRSKSAQISKFWKSLEDQNLVPSAGNSKVPMMPLYIMLMKEVTQESSMALISSSTDKFPTRNKFFITAFRASMKNDIQAGEVLSLYPGTITNTEDLIAEVKKVISGTYKSKDEKEKLKAAAKEARKEKIQRNAMGFIVHANIEDIPKDSFVFFHRSTPGVLNCLKEKNCIVIVADPTPTTMASLVWAWPTDDEFALSNLMPCSYGGSGKAVSCAIVGGSLLPRDNRQKAPRTGSILQKYFELWTKEDDDAEKENKDEHDEMVQDDDFNGDWKIHVVTGYHEQQ